MTRGGHLVTVSALPARREHRELGAPPTMIGLRARRPFVRGSRACCSASCCRSPPSRLLTSGCNTKSLHLRPLYLRSTSTAPSSTAHR